MYIRTSVYIHVCVYVHLHVFLYIHVHIHKCTGRLIDNLLKCCVIVAVQYGQVARSRKRHLFSVSPKHFFGWGSVGPVVSGSYVPWRRRSQSPPPPHCSGAGYSLGKENIPKAHCAFSDFRDTQHEHLHTKTFPLNLQNTPPPFF